MTSVENPIWQRTAQWWNEPRLMEIRDGWITKQVQIVDEITDTFPNGFVSKPEWRATVAEAAFDNSAYRQSVLPDGPANYWALHQMRKTWAEEAMMFFTIGQPIEPEFRPTAHQEAMDRHFEERLCWRPHHRLPGEPSGQYSPVPEEGLTHQWWAPPYKAYLHLCRQRTISALLDQNDSLAQVFADDPSTDVSDARKWLVRKQHFGWPLAREDEKVKVSEEQDHFERGVFAMMRGYLGELKLYTDGGVPVIRRYDPQEVANKYQERNLSGEYRSPYLTKGSEGW